MFPNSLATKRWRGRSKGDAALAQRAALKDSPERPGGFNTGLATLANMHRNVLMGTRRAAGGWVRWAVAGWMVASASVSAQTMGLFTFPHVDAHRMGIPGVTRTMWMAGPAMMGTGMGMGGGMGTPVVNPHWTGAAAMFAPELLLGRGMLQGQAGAVSGGGFGANAGMSGRWGQVPQRPAAPVAMASATAATRSSSLGMKPGNEAGNGSPADARLLAFQQAEARKGSPGAQRALALRYEKGDGVEASEEMARAWRMAAERTEKAAGLP